MAPEVNQYTELLLSVTSGTNSCEIAIKIQSEKCISECDPQNDSHYVNQWAMLLRPQGVNSLWPSDVIWRQGPRSTLAQVIACCLTGPSHYLNQCWPMISEVLWHSPYSNFTENTHKETSLISHASLESSNKESIKKLKIFIVEMSLKFTNLRL